MPEDALPAADDGTAMEVVACSGLVVMTAVDEGTVVTTTGLEVDGDDEEGTGTSSDPAMIFMVIRVDLRVALPSKGSAPPCTVVMISLADTPFSLTRKSASDDRLLAVSARRDQAKWLQCAHQKIPSGHHRTS